MTTVEPEFHYRFGIDLFVAGVEAMAPPAFPLAVQQARVHGAGGLSQLGKLDDRDARSAELLGATACR